MFTALPPMMRRPRRVRNYWGRSIAGNRFTCKGKWQQAETRRSKPEIRKKSEIRKPKVEEKLKVATGGNRSQLFHDRLFDFSVSTSIRYSNSVSRLNFGVRVSAFGFPALGFYSL